MNRTLHEKAEQFDALVEMLIEDGASAAGETPPVEHIRALQDAPLRRADEVRAAHAEGRGPPSFAEGRVPPEGRGPQSNGGGN